MKHLPESARPMAGAESTRARFVPTGPGAWVRYMRSLRRSMPEVAHEVEPWDPKQVIPPSYAGSRLVTDADRDPFRT